DGGDSYVARGPARWGSPRSGWHVFRDEFVGVSWFLWAGGPQDAVGVAAHRLREAFTTLAGEPEDRVELADGSGRFTAFWQVDGRGAVGRSGPHGGHPGGLRADQPGRRGAQGLLPAGRGRPALAARLPERRHLRLRPRAGRGPGTETARAVSRPGR